MEFHLLRNDATGDEERFKIIHPPKTKMTMEDAKTTIWVDVSDISYYSNGDFPAEPC